MELTPRQRDQIRDLLEEALRDAGRAAVDKNDAAAVGEFVAGRRRALEQKMSAGAADDHEDPLDQDGEGGGVGGQP